MKNISLALNGILAIAIIILYYLHFSTNETTSTTEPKEEVEQVEAPIIESIEEISSNSNIGYINVDSLQDNYKLYEEMINKLKARQNKYEREITVKSTAFEKKVQEFQKKAPTMSQFEGQMKQKELAEEEQKLYKMRDDFAAKFQEEELKLNDQFQQKVKAYIQEHNKTSNFDIIIGASQLGNIVLDYREGINITNAVVIGLNKQYEAEKTKK
jgi:outer membrane protein